MVRPENIMILFVLISIFLLIKLLKNKNLNSKNYIILLISLFLVGSIKLNGFIYVLCFFGFLLLAALESSAFYLAVYLYEVEIIDVI